MPALHKKEEVRIWYHPLRYCNHLTVPPRYLHWKTFQRGVRNLNLTETGTESVHQTHSWRLGYRHALSGLFLRLINSGMSCLCLFCEAYTGRIFSFSVLDCHASLQAIVRFMHGCKVTVIHERCWSFIRTNNNVEQMTRMQ